MDGGESGWRWSGFSEAKRPTREMAADGLVAVDLGWPRLVRMTAKPGGLGRMPGCEPGSPGARSRMARALPSRLTREAWPREDLPGLSWARVGLARLIVRGAGRGVTPGQRCAGRGRARHAGH